MALLPALIKNGLAVALALAFCAAPAAATTFKAKRGLNLDLWVTWPGEERWEDPDVLLPFPEWRRSLDAARLRALKADGFDFLRMPIDPAPLLSDKTLALRDRLYDDVLASVRLATAAGLKVVVDMHSIPWGDDRTFSTGKAMDDPAMFDAYVEMLRRIAGMLASEDPEMVALEVMNEPTMECGDGTWQERLKRLFAAARASATRLTLLLPGACWGSADGLSRLDPAAFPDDNLIWTFHAYEPFLLTHQGATWAGDFIPYVTGIPYPPSSVSKDEIDVILGAIRGRMENEAPLTRRAGLLAYLGEQYAEIDTPEKLQAVMAKPFETVAAWARQHGVAPENILLGEFGMIRQEYGTEFVMNPEWRAGYVRDMIGLAEKNGFAWSIWGYGGAFGVVEAFDGRAAEPDVLDVVRGLEGQR